jgi:hypothetical protein
MHHFLLSSAMIILIGLSVLGLPADAQEPYQENVAQSRPAPGQNLIGLTVYTNGEGATFNRIPMTRDGYPAQEDTVVYVSASPIAGDSGANRVLAGLVAQKLSAAEGILYRISNKYERKAAGISPLDPGHYLTILPDIAYQAGRPHPSVSYYIWRETAAIPAGSNGPLYDKVNHGARIGEFPNGDLLASWHTGNTEDGPDGNTAGSRLRYGQDEWDSVTSLFYDTTNTNE